MTAPAPAPAAFEERLAQALTLHGDGRLGEAEAIYRSVLAADSGHFAALLHLGVLRLQQGSHEDALELLRQALRRNPQSAEAHSNLAAALDLAGRPEEAVLAYEEALAIDPDRPEAHYGLGASLHALRRFDEAIACYERALVIDPDYAEASCGLGAALHAVKQHERALASYGQALAVDPDYVEALCGRAAVLRQLRRHGEAVAAYQRAVAIAPDHVGALAALGAALQAADRHEEALVPLRRALALDPRSAATQLALGAVLEELGRLEEARQAFAAAVALEPENVRFRVALAAAKRTRDGDPDLAIMEDWARDIGERPEDEQILLHFALGRALSEIGRHEDSFRHLSAGNALQRQLLVYDEPATLATFERIAAAFTLELMRAKGRAGHPSPAPIFIIGMPRSGSTLVEQILASHPAIVGGGERHDFAEAMLMVAGGRGRPSLPELARTMTLDQLYRLGAAYLDRLGAAHLGRLGATTTQRITDKMLANFCFAGLIHLALPNARIVHTCRDPVDTCLSCFAQLFGAEQPFAYDLGELGRYYRGYARLMEHWRRVLPPGVVLDVHYEELVGDFEPQARRIVAHCGLDWDDACLSFHQTQRVVRTASVTQVRQPLYRGSVGRWRPAEAVLRPLLDGLAPPAATAPAADFLG